MSYTHVTLQAYLNGINVPGLFMVKTLVVKIIGSMGAVAGGLAIGKEGPFVHAGACIGALLSQVGGQNTCRNKGAMHSLIRASLQLATKPAQSTYKPPSIHTCNNLLQAHCRL